MRAESDILYLNLAGKHMVILNSFKAAKELLDKRSAIYSSRCVRRNILSEIQHLIVVPRPRFIMIREL